MPLLWMNVNLLDLNTLLMFRVTVVNTVNQRESYLWSLTVNKFIWSIFRRQDFMQMWRIARVANTLHRTLRKVKYFRILLSTNNWYRNSKVPRFEFVQTNDVIQVTPVPHQVPTPITNRCITHKEMIISWFQLFLGTLFSTNLSKSRLKSFR